MQQKNLLLILFVIIIIIVSFGILFYFQFNSDISPSSELFIFDSETAISKEIPLRDYVKRIDFVKINLNAFDFDTISLNLFDELIYVTNTEITYHETSFRWLGSISGSAIGTASFSVFDNGHIIGNLRMGADLVTIKYFQDDISIIRDIDLGKIPDEGDDIFIIPDIDLGNLPNDDAAEHETSMVEVILTSLKKNQVITQSNIDSE